LKQAITLIDPSGGVLSVIACYHPRWTKPRQQTSSRGDSACGWPHHRCRNRLPDKVRSETASQLTFYSFFHGRLNQERLAVDCAVSLTFKVVGVGHFCCGAIPDPPPIKPRGIYFGLDYRPFIASPIRAGEAVRVRVNPVQPQKSVLKQADQ